MSTIYRKYRPKTFSNISGQKYVLQTLTNAIKNSQFGQAYLFTGPRGTGKTTTARIFAKTINCLHPQTKTRKKYIKIEPCNKCSNCKMILNNKALDIIEIDAASHTGVDNIRQLKDAINIPPSNLQYKVYIIDEVHMLSLGAFNALLKTLEEPPSHTVFILATTELHKVPETIISRCQQFNIEPLTKEEIIERLESIAKKEKIKINQDALDLIATEANGGMRDAESLFGQLISLNNKKISAENVRNILGISSKKTISNLVSSIKNQNLMKTIEIINKLQSNGINLKSFTKQLLNYFRNMMLLKIAPETNNLLFKKLTKEEIEKIKKETQDFNLANLILLINLIQDSLEKNNRSDIPQLSLEMALIKYSLKTAEKTANPIQQSNPSATKTTLNSPKKKVLKQNNEPPIKNKPNLTTEISSQNKRLPSNFDINTFLEHWTEILEKVAKVNQTLSGFLNSCIPKIIENNYIIIETKFPFHEKQLNAPQNKLTIEKVFANILKVPLRVKFIEKKIKPTDKKNVKENEITTKKELSAKNSQNSKKKSKEELLYQALRQVGGKIID